AVLLAFNMIGDIITAGRVEVGPVHLLLAPMLLAATLFLLWAGGGAASLDGRRASRRTGVQPDGRGGRAPPPPVRPCAENGQTGDYPRTGPEQDVPEAHDERA